MQLAKKAFQANGKEIVVTLVKMGDMEGMFIKDVAALLGTSTSNVHENMKNHGMVSKNFGSHQIATLKSQGLIDKRVSVIKVVPRDTIRQLVRIVGTPEAQAAYDHLWDIAENPAVAAEHYKAIGREAELLAEIAKLKDAESQMPLTQEQRGALNRLMEQRLRELCINPMAEWTYKTSLDIEKERSPKSMIQWDLRCNYFSEGFGARLFWQDIPRSNFDGCVVFVKAWQPSEKQLSTLRYKKALMYSQDDLATIRAEKAIAASLKSEEKLYKRKAKQAALLEKAAARIAAMNKKKGA